MARKGLFMLAFGTIGLALPAQAQGDPFTPVHCAFFTAIDEGTIDEPFLDFNGFRFTQEEPGAHMEVRDGKLLFTGRLEIESRWVTFVKPTGLATEEVNFFIRTGPTEVVDVRAMNDRRGPVIEDTTITAGQFLEFTAGPSAHFITLTGANGRPLTETQELHWVCINVTAR